MNKYTKKINAQEMLIANCLNYQDRYFRVPDYQRRYSWGKEQIEDFWFDLNSLEYQNEEHFLGSIVVITRDNPSNFTKLELVDGQQRLTTIILLLKNISNAFINHSQEQNLNIRKIGRKIKNKFLNAENNMFEQRSRLELGKLDHEDYESIIHKEKYKNISNKKLIDSYKFFKKQLKNYQLKIF